MYSSDSLELITFQIDESITTSPITRDYWTRNRAFVKSGIIRNNQPLDVVSYRLAREAEFKTIPILSEKPIKGWFSYLEITSAAGAIDIETELELVTWENAKRK